ncbi:MAG: hypothetical protein Q9227_007611 [Pyrenula ochraceoflavens]
MPPTSRLCLLEGVDSVSVRNLRLDLIVGKDAWGREGKPQPVVASAWLYLSNAIKEASRTDDVTKGVDYSKLCKSIVSTLKSQNEYSDIFAIAAQISSSELLGIWQPGAEHRIAGSRIEASLPKGVLRSSSGLRYAMSCERDEEGNLFIMQSIEINDIACACIIGINPHERLEKQPVSISLFFRYPATLMKDLQSISDSNPVQKMLPCFQEMVKTVAERIEVSAYQTVEALATFVAQIVTMQYMIPEVTVKVEKPFAIMSIDCPVIEITRTRDFFQNTNFWGGAPA